MEVYIIIFLIYHPISLRLYCKVLSVYLNDKGIGCVTGRLAWGVCLTLVPSVALDATVL